MKDYHLIFGHTFALGRLVNFQSNIWVKKLSKTIDSCKFQMNKEFFRWCGYKSTDLLLCYFTFMFLLTISYICYMLLYIISSSISFMEIHHVYTYICTMLILLYYFHCAYTFVKTFEPNIFFWINWIEFENHIPLFFVCVACLFTV